MRPQRAAEANSATMSLEHGILMRAMIQRKAIHFPPDVPRETIGG
jgi:hypothetical protein